MIDHDISRELHSLAATVDEPIDLDALHRRISAHGRRRAAVKVGCAGLGLAAIVGGLVVVREDRTSPAASQPSPAEPAGLPACDDVLAGLRAATAKPAPDTGVPKDIPADRSGSAEQVSNLGFKGIVTILAIDGARLTFRVDEPGATPAVERAGTLDGATEWVDGGTPLDAPPTLHVGDQLGLATTLADDGVDHVLLVDVGPTSVPRVVEDKPAPDMKERTATESSTVDPGVTLPPGPTAKGLGTITAADATSITVTLDDASGQALTMVIDRSTTPFRAGDTTCAPGALAVDETLGVGYHLDDAGTVVADVVLLMP